MDRLCFVERFLFPSVQRRSQINEFLYKTALFFWTRAASSSYSASHFFPGADRCADAEQLFDCVRPYRRVGSIDLVFHDLGDDRH